MSIGSIIVEKVDSHSDSGWFCMDLMGFMVGLDEELFYENFNLARSGSCPYRDICPRYKRTIERRNKPSSCNKTGQLSLFDNIDFF